MPIIAPATTASPISRNAGAGTGVADGGGVSVGTGVGSSDSLNVLPSDLHIVKTYPNAFNKTELAGDLQAIGVDTVIITGFCAEYCILSTYCGARDLDLTPVLLRNALASGKPESSISYSCLQSSQSRYMTPDGVLMAADAMVAKDIWDTAGIFYFTNIPDTRRAADEGRSGGARGREPEGAGSPGANCPGRHR
jgi:hypothetical protein